MPGFSREWMTELTVSKEHFIHHFYNVVQPDQGGLLINTPSLARDISSDFFGRVRQRSFSVWKRKGLWDPRGRPPMDGTITEKGTHILLHLKMTSTLTFSYFSVVLLDIFLAALVILIMNGGPRDLTRHSASDYLGGILILAVVVGLAHYLQVKLMNTYLDDLQGLYDEVILSIESEAMAASESITPQK